MSAQSQTDWERYVQPNWSKIVGHVAFSQTLEAALMEKGLMSYNDLEEVKQKGTEYEKISSLVWKFLKTKGPGSVKTFCDALRQAGSSHASEIIEDAMAERKKASSGHDTTDGGKATEGSFPSDDSKVTDDLMRVIARIGFGHWQSIATELLSIDAVNELSGSNKVKLMTAISNWKLGSDNPTVGSLLNRCEKGGLHKANIKKEYCNEH
eukprot:m.15765 g.15765  ORF g.15765 m.15765 type:complete len:209 (+) comp26532_c0_seq2:39-665(+)